MIVAWVALGLGLMNLAVWGIVVVAARRLWRQVGPQVSPLLAMFTPAATSATIGTPDDVQAVDG